MITTRVIENAETLAIAHQIRHQVFVIEQNCPPELEYEFEDESIHFLATIDNIPAGTARWRKTEKGIKLERFAVLKSFRNQGVGNALVKAVLEHCPHDEGPIYLHAQLTAAPLYAKHKFVETGNRFWEAGIEHIKMVWSA